MTTSSTPLLPVQEPATPNTPATLHENSDDIPQVPAEPARSTPSPSPHPNTTATAAVPQDVPPADSASLPGSPVSIEETRRAVPVPIPAQPLADPARVRSARDQMLMRRPGGPAYASRPGSAPPFSTFDFVQRHFLYLTLSALVSLLISWYAAQEFAKSSYNYNSQLLYSQLGSEELGYVSPNLIAITPLISTRRVLGAAIEDLEMDLDVEELEEAVEVEVPYESSLFTVVLNWPEEDSAAEVLDSIVEHFMQVVADARRDSIARTLTRVHDGIKNIESDINGYRQSLHDFNSTHRVLDLDTELSALNLQIDLLEDRLSQTAHRLEGDLAKLTALTAKGTGPEQESSAKNAQTSMRLEEYKVTKDLLSDEEQRIKQKADLDFHERQFAMDQELYRAQLISKTEFEASRHKLETLRATYHPSLQKMRSQVHSAESEIKQMLQNGDTAPLITASASTMKASVEMSIISGEVEARRLAEQLEEKQQRQQELAENRMESESLNAELKTLAAERERLQRRAIDLQNFDVDRPLEFTVIQPAGPALNAVSSNRKKLMLGGFGGCLFLLAGPLLLRDALKTHRTSRT